ncbi:MAG: Crp/Fnr family transcriptional regulator [Cocleimonas sp.]|nr:Crp/Fnr family transcriptional regulator [Cocleimonas sp.]
MTLTPSQKNTLRSTSLFSDLSEESYLRVIKKSRVVSLLTAQQLFEQGQPVSDFFFLLEGQLKLTRLSPEGGEKVIEIINSGNSFAEAAVFGKFSGYPVNCFAICDSLLFKINATTYINELRSSIDSCFAVMGRLSLRTHSLLSEVDRLTLHNATHRLGVYLLDGIEAETGRIEIELIAPKHVIASRLSIKPETLSRTFKRLVESEQININEKHIVILDLRAFRKFITLG